MRCGSGWRRGAADHPRGKEGVSPAEGLPVLPHRACVPQSLESRVTRGLAVTLVPHSVPPGPLLPSQDFLKAPLGCCSMLSLQRGKRGWILGVNLTYCGFPPSNVKIPF